MFVQVCFTRKLVYEINPLNVGVAPKDGKNKDFEKVNLKLCKNSDRHRVDRGSKTG